MKNNTKKSQPNIVLTIIIILPVVIFILISSYIYNTQYAERGYLAMVCICGIFMSAYMIILATIYMIYDKVKTSKNKTNNIMP